MGALYRIEDRDLLIGLLSGEGGFRGAAVVLEGLTAEQTFAKPQRPSAFGRGDRRAHVLLARVVHSMRGRGLCRRGGARL